MLDMLSLLQGFYFFCYLAYASVRFLFTFKWMSMKDFAAKYFDNENQKAVRVVIPNYEPIQKGESMKNNPLFNQSLTGEP